MAAGVAALIIALAINNGFQSTLQSSLLSATAHVNILERNPAYGIEHWEQLIPKLLKIPHVTSATPGLYGQVAFKGPLVGTGGVMKGVLLDNKDKIPDLLRHLKAGSLRAVRADLPDPRSSWARVWRNSSDYVCIARLRFSASRGNSRRWA